MDLSLRHQYNQIPIGDELNKDPVWIKKLELILDSDIHSKPLGCKIVDTHIKIGEVHMGAFYEAQILFSHARWIRKFSEWLNSEIQKELEGKSDIKNIVIIGYETYIEPVLYTLKQSLIENVNCSVYYGIYEEPKFIQNKVGAKTEVRIRYIEDIETALSIRGNNKTEVFFVCGISSTLSTLKKMRDLFYNRIKKRNLLGESTFYTLIQVLPENEDNIYQMIWERKENKKLAHSLRNEISAQYLVSVMCKWFEADKCSLCFPQNPVDEKPIIQTSETSIVPIQMISSVPKRNVPKMVSKGRNSQKEFNLFVKKGGLYKYKDYLYYNHIDRMDHHYKYYIRTGHLFKKILSEESERNKFILWCQKIRDELGPQENTVNIIISPSHFSDEVFPIAINRYVFDGKAHMISFDPKKEFRSNFETKYSNIAYFIQQIKNSKKKISIRFFYVDDQIVSGDMYYRVKSLVKSLMSENHLLSEKIQVFDAVIIFLSRISDSSKLDYVKDIERYYSFIDIEISSIRNYGDSCPICKLKYDSYLYTQVSALDVCAEHWSDKYWYHSTKTLNEVKKKRSNLIQNEREILSERHFRRMECENILYKNTKDCFSKEEFIDSIIGSIYSKKDRSGNIPCEYFISFIKAIAVPFLYYKENEKKAAIYILLNFITQIREAHDNPLLLYQFNINNKCLSIKFDNEYEKYSLIVVLINCLAEMDSAYLLNVQRISDLCSIVKKINPDLLDFERVHLGDKSVEGFYNVIVNACKRIICGISGEARIKHLDQELEYVLINYEHSDELERLWRALYLENSNVGSSLDDEEKGGIDNKNPVIFTTLREYENISNKLKTIFKKDNIRIYFIYYDNTLEANWFYLHNSDCNIFGDVTWDQIDLLQSIPKEGVVWDEKECIVRLHYYDIEGIMGPQEHQKATQNEVKKDVFLCIRFDKIIEIEQLRIIRDILQYRYELCKKIAKDISTDAIKAAIQAKASEDLLKSDKAISHGAKEELSLLVMQAASLIESYYLKRGENCEPDEEKKLFLDACNGINIIMNRCIGYSNTHQIIQKYFTPQDPNLKAKSKHNPFYNSIQDTNSKVWKQGWDFFIQYLKELRTKNSAYLTELIKNRTEISNIIISFEQEVDEVVNSILQADTIPFFLNAGGAPAKYSMMFLIGILDAFVRNAIKHGVVKNNELKIRFEIFSNEDGKKGQYKIQISNETNPAKDNTGITKKFFDMINEEKMDNADNYFEVFFEVRQEEEHWEHFSILNIIRNFIGSESV